MAKTNTTALPSLDLSAFTAAKAAKAPESTEARVVLPKPYAKKVAAMDILHVDDATGDRYAIAEFLQIEVSALTTAELVALIPAIVKVANETQVTYKSEKTGALEPALAFHTFHRPAFAKKFCWTGKADNPLAALSHACDMIVKSPHGKAAEFYTAVMTAYKANLSK